MKLFRTANKSNTEFFINLENVTAVHKDNVDNTAIIECIGSDEDRTYFTNEPFDSLIRRLMMGEWI